MKHIRQGDVLLSLIQILPPTAIPQSSRIVAEGEATGHHHALVNMTAQIYNTTTARYVVVEQPTVLTHQEHKPIELPQGIFEIKIQRELDLLGEIRQVMD